MDSGRLNKDVGSTGCAFRKIERRSNNFSAGEDSSGSGKGFTVEALLAKPSKNTSLNPVRMNEPYRSRSFSNFVWTYNDLKMTRHHSWEIWPSFRLQYTECDRRLVEDISFWSPSTEKRIRTTFTGAQLRRLEDQFRKRQYIVGKERECLADELGLDDNQVKVWFQNRRIKWRKHQREMEKQRTAAVEDVSAE